MFYHGNDRKLIDSDITDIRFDFRLFQNPVNITSRSIFCNDKWLPFKSFDWHSITFSKRMVLWNDCKEFIVHYREKLIIMSLLMADKANVYTPLLDPVGKFTLDSKQPKGGYQEFLMNEARYSRLTREFPERANELFERNEESAKARYEHLLKLVEMYKD